MPRKPFNPLPKPIESSKVLLVEGTTPLNFFTAALRHLGLEDQVEIRDFGGITQLATFLQTLAATADFREKVRSLGVTRDAEASAAGARASVDSAITRAALGAGVRTAVFIFPDNDSPGNIESLCLQSVADSPIMQCVNAFVDCAANGGTVWAQGYEQDKARVQIFASTLESPTGFAGLAAYRGAWPWTSPAFNEVFGFLRSL